MPRFRRTTDADPDVFICCREPSGVAAARRIAEGLTRRGFRVHFEARGDAGTGGERFLAIEAAPDFLLVLSGDALDGLDDPRDPVHAELAHALHLGRVVVPVCLPGARVPLASALPASIATLAARPAVAFDEARFPESLARVAHALSSDAEVEDRRLMRRATQAMVLAASIVLAAALSFVLPPVYRALTAPRPLAPLPPFTVAWAGLVQRGAAGSAGAVDLADGLAIGRGDRVKLAFAPGSDGFAYVIVLSRAGHVIVLHPPHAMRGASAVRAGRVYAVPAAIDWAVTDDRDLPEVLYLVAGYDPLENLEELCDDGEGGIPARERENLLASTVAGLLDGRHASAARNLRTRSGRSVDARQPAPPLPSAARLLLADGTALERPFAVETGLISVAVEIRVRVDSGR